MKFVLISRHTGGRTVPADEGEQLLKDLGAWLSLLTDPAAFPIRGGKSVTSKAIEEYVGEVGGVILFEADDVEQAARLAQRSPGLKYGWTHDVFPIISLESASKAGN